MPASKNHHVTKLLHSVNNFLQCNLRKVKDHQAPSGLQPLKTEFVYILGVHFLSAAHYAESRHSVSWVAYLFLSAVQGACKQIAIFLIYQSVIDTYHGHGKYY